jgi:hypothetical protein
MPNWKKLIVSGSDAALNSLNVTSALTASGLNYPTSDGSGGQVLVTDGAGNLSFDIPDAEKLTFEVQNGETFTLAKGTPIHVSSSTNGTSIIIAASASDASTMPAHGVLNQQLTAGSDGVATIIGNINGVDTSAFSVGDTIFVGASGGYTNVKPQGSDNLIQNLGVVRKVDASNGTGEIFGSGRTNDVPNLPEGKIWVGSSNYTVTSSIVHLDETNSTAQITGSLDVQGSVTGSSFTGSFVGDGSGLAGVVVDIFPYSGSAIITGSVGFAYSIPDIPAAWSAGGTMNNGRYLLGGAGTQNAGLAFGGEVSSNCTEEYNGSSWTTEGALSVSRKGLAGAGTQNAGLAFGGANITPALARNSTEEYNGSSWTAGGNLSTARAYLAGAGTQNAGLAAGGGSGPISNTIVTCAEEYDGASWSAGGVLGNGQYLWAGAGTQNAGLAFGGFGPTTTGCTQEYNGTSWSGGGSLSVSRWGLAAAGLQNAALAFGGNTGPSAGSSARTCTEEYNGTSWSNSCVLPVGMKCHAGAGTTSAALSFGGQCAPQVTTGVTYEFTTQVGSVNQTFTYSDSTGLVNASGSFSGSFEGDGSGLTGITADSVPFTGITGTPTIISSSLQFDTITSPFTGSFTGSFTGDGSGLTNVIAEVTEQATVSDTFTSTTSKVVTHNFNTKNIIVIVYNSSDQQILPATLTTTDNNNVTVTFDTATSGRVVVAKGGHIVSGSGTYGSLIGKPFFEGSQTNITSGSVTNINTIPTSSYSAAIFDYAAYSSSNARAGTLTSTNVGTTITYNEVSTSDIGDTTPLELSVVISGSNFTLQALTSTSGWAVKSHGTGI